MLTYKFPVFNPSSPADGSEPSRMLVTLSPVDGSQPSQVLYPVSPYIIGLGL